MKTELSWLVDLLLTQKLSPGVKKLLGDRIAEVEASLRTSTTSIQVPNLSVSQWNTTPIPPSRPTKDPTAQAPSTQKILAQDPTSLSPVSAPLTPEIIAAAHAVPTSAPVAQVAQTPAAAQALASRQEALRAALSGRGGSSELGVAKRKF